MGTFDYNKDVQKRDELIFGSYDQEAYRGGIRRFSDITVETLKTLIDEKFADPDSTQGMSPTIQEMIDFAEEHGKNFRFGGYVVSIQRIDYRVTIDEIDAHEFFKNRNYISDFESFAGNASEMDGPCGWAWWEN